MPTQVAAPSSDWHAYGRAVVAAAEADLGKGHGPGRRGAFPDMVLGQLGLALGQNYCAAAVTYWLKQAAGSLGIAPPIRGSGMAKALREQALAMGAWVDAKTLREGARPPPGSIPVWDRHDPSNPASQPWWGHTGVLRAWGPGDAFQTVEANHGAVVAHVQRSLAEPRLLGMFDLALLHGGGGPALATPAPTSTKLLWAAVGLAAGCALTHLLLGGSSYLPNLPLVVPEDEVGFDGFLDQHPYIRVAVDHPVMGHISEPLARLAFHRMRDLSRTQSEDSRVRVAEQYNRELIRDLNEAGERAIAEARGRVRPFRIKPDVAREVPEVTNALWVLDAWLRGFAGFRFGKHGAKIRSSVAWDPRQGGAQLRRTLHYDVDYEDYDLVAPVRADGAVSHVFEWRAVPVRRKRS